MKSEHSNTRDSALRSWKLHIHHIGARGETQSFPGLGALDCGVVNVLYEADHLAVEEIYAINAKRAAEVIVLPVCLSDGKGRRTFHHSIEGFNSSLYPINPGVSSLYFPWIDYDHVFAQAAEHVRSDIVDTRSLDTALTADFPDIGMPDVLSIDAEGSDLDILKGANTVLENAVVVVVETEYLPLYEHQPLFADIFKFLFERDFLFAEVVEPISGAFFRGPIGARGRRFQFSGNAFFFKDPTTIDLRDGVGTGHRRLLKLAMLSICAGHIEHGLFALETLERSGVGSRNTTPDLLWIRTLGAFRKLIAKFPTDTFPDYKERKQLERAGNLQSRYADLGRAMPLIKRCSDELIDFFDNLGLVVPAASIRSQFAKDADRLKTWFAFGGAGARKDYAAKGFGAIRSILAGKRSDAAVYKHAFETTAVDRDRWKEKAEQLEIELQYLKENLR